MKKLSRNSDNANKRNSVESIIKHIPAESIDSVRWIENHVSVHCADPRHAFHTRDLALGLFDALRQLHGYESRQRLILEAASLLHDIGMTPGHEDDHHKISRDIILSLEMPGIHGNDRILCAQVARFHRKSEPDREKHKTFTRLASEERLCVQWLSGILRVADGLDRCHIGLVDRPTIVLTSAECLIRIQSRQAVYEAEAATRKGGLLQTLMGRKLTILLNGPGDRP